MRLRAKNASSKLNKRQLRLAMRELKWWGADLTTLDDPDIAPLVECYQYTRDRGNGVAYLLYRAVA